ncbi:Borealin N terminal-domain-containing protein [Aspergillus pseudoustus]|uniref:Borealin N terminal-domain-containing protein n=1 Tax=Aspergillus pseudoustus TaxID=1810923 RepID=A0ABR4JPH6_9EURO
MTTGTKRKSSDMGDAYPAEDVTPTNSPPRKRMRMTRNQKQALMDNLQLEITERARKLRAQYALQAQDLRARIERRVNRIPIALRKANMGELLEKHNAALREQLENSPRKYRSPAKGSRNFTAISASGRKKATTASPSPRRVRKHSPAGIYSDKENAPASGEQLDVLKNPKRRAKPGAAGGTSRVVSQEVRGADYRILSPKSSNSRTYPQSPLRASPEKSQPSSYLSRPMSPLKPSSPLKSTSANRPGSSRGAIPARPQSAQTTRPGSRAATGGPRSIRSPLSRPATRQGERRGSVSSTTSSGTTIANTSRSTASRKVTTASTASAAAKKAAVARSQAPSAASKRTATSGTRKATASSAGGESTTGGRRTLRKRA